MNQRLSIGVVRLGGLGDNINCTAILTGIKRKFPNSHITFYCRDYADSFRSFGVIDTVLHVGNINWHTFVEHEWQKYQVFYDLRYAARVFFRSDVEKELAEYKAQTDAKFKEYQEYYDRFPASSHRLGQLGKTIHELAKDTTCLDFSVDDQFIEIAPGDRKLLRAYQGRKFVTVHDWADLRKQTKCWYLDYWKEVVEFLNGAGLLVLQVGRQGEQDIPGAMSLLGRGNVHETAALLGAARLHVDIEGGLVHVARAVNTKSVVIFGPTPVSMFGYKENINLSAVDEVCSPCWWKENDWHVRCIESKDKICMRTVTPERVIQAIEKELGSELGQYRRTRKKATSKVRSGERILVCRDAAFGDVLMITPTIRGLKEQYPQSQIDVATLPQMLDIFQHNSSVNAALNSKGAREPYSKTVVLDGVYEKHPERSVRHLIDLFAESARVIPNERHLELTLTEDDMKGAQRILDKSGVDFDFGYWVGLHVRNWPFSDSKNIPLEHYETLIRELQDLDPDLGVLLLAGKGEFTFRSRPRAKNLAGKTDHRQLAAILKQCRFVIGPDSGILHAAASQKTPTIGIYGPARPQTLASYGHDFIALYSNRDCAPCLDSMCRFKTTDCMRDISPEKILNAVKFRMGIGSRKLSIVIATMNQLYYLRRCVDEVEKNTQGINYEVIIIDNGSSESGMREYLLDLRKRDNFKIIFEPTNTGVGRAWNRAIRNSQGEYLCVLNNDAEVEKNWARYMIENLERDPNIGVVGLKLLFPKDRKVQHAGMAVSPARDDYFHIYHGVSEKDPKVCKSGEMPAVTGACQIFRREDYFKVNGYEERYFAYCEDTDFCLKMRSWLGKTCYYEARAVALHHVAKTSSHMDLRDKRRVGLNLFRQKWSTWMEQEKV